MLSMMANVNAGVIRCTFQNVQIDVWNLFMIFIAMCVRKARSKNNENMAMK